MNKYFDTQQFGAVTELNSGEILKPFSMADYKDKPDMTPIYNKMLNDLGVYDIFLGLTKSLNSRRGVNSEEAFARESNAERILQLITMGSMRYAFQKDFFKLPDLKPLINDIAKCDPMQYVEKSKIANDPIAILNWLDVEATIPLLYEQLLHDTTRYAKRITSNIATMSERNDKELEIKNKLANNCEIKEKRFIEEHCKDYPYIVEIVKNSYDKPAISKEKHSLLMDFRDNTLCNKNVRQLSWSGKKFTLPNMTTKVKELITIEN